MKVSDLEDADNVVAKDHLDRFETKLMERFNTIDARFNILDAKVNAVEAKINTVDARTNALEAKVDRLSAKIDRVSRSIWIPAVAATAQLLFLAFHKQLEF